MAIDESSTTERSWLLAAYRGEVTTDNALAAVVNLRRSPAMLAADPEATAALAEGDSRHPDDPRRWPTSAAPWELDVDIDGTVAFDALTARDQNLLDDTAALDTAVTKLLDRLRALPVEHAAVLRHDIDRIRDHVEYVHIAARTRLQDEAAGAAVARLDALPDDQRDLAYDNARLLNEIATLEDKLEEAYAPLDDDQGDETGPSTWQPIDLTDAWAGTDVPGPELLTRTDGYPLLYRGRTHWFQGESETCKSWAAQIAATQVLVAGGRVLYIDFEDDDRGVVARLLALGAERSDRFTYLRPEEPLSDGRGRTTRGGIDFARVLARSPYDLAIIDGVTEAMTAEGLDLLSNADVAIWLRRLPKRLASTGAAVACIDHVTKSIEGRGRHAIGGQHKLAGITGAAFTFTTIKPFYRGGLDTVTGTIDVKVVKDRPGHLRSRAVDDKIATLELTSYPDGGVTGRLVATTLEDQEPPPEPKLLRAIFEHLDLYDGCPASSIEKGVGGRCELVRSALKWMAAPSAPGRHGDPWIRVEKKGNSHRHYLTDAGREAAP